MRRIKRFNEQFNEEFDAELEYNKIYNRIIKYISFTLSSKEQINKYVPNTHIAEVFRDVLIHCELECMYPSVYHNHKSSDGYNSVKPGTESQYDFKNGLYYKKETERYSFMDIVFDYFDPKRLKQNGEEEIESVYQRLREKKDPLRNLMKLVNIIIPRKYCVEHLSKRNLEAHKIRIKSK